jgi:hypothetical protein
VKLSQRTRAAPAPKSGKKYSVFSAKTYIKIYALIIFKYTGSLSARFWQLASIIGSDDRSARAVRSRSHPCVKCRLGHTFTAGRAGASDLRLAVQRRIKPQSQNRHGDAAHAIRA